ncbi:MAG: hypothetical protein GOVbin1096_96 [Prokaryotic dsDNA virus sp.]|jgi:hypothetical protein|nr:MAG: hypothetical protein GOVbin1096_96 [Prokaryotic dsDNA virus sp.]|tara:strand:+ start:20044 stop:20517 length:474 start_codon:yes stop_codon:yes gene_type:complete
MSNNFYCGVGARETPDDVLRLMTRIGRGLMKKGYKLRSGGAKGADSAFEKGIPRALKEIFIANDDLPRWTHVFTEYFHPAPHNLKDYGKRLMCRNAMQILGQDGDTPVEFVVCWTKDGKDSGGTGQAIRIAEYFYIPVFNLKNEDAYEELKEFVNGG